VPAANVPVPAAAVPQYDLPLARQPFDKNWPVHNLENMDIPCSDCGALHWKSEKLSSSPQIRPKFGTCCFSGKVQIHRLHDLPLKLLDLFRGQDDISKNFRQHIRNYNSALAMTSLGCQQNHAINRAGAGPYVFKVQGSLYHETGSLMGGQGIAPKYAQLYIHDSQKALDFRMNHGANAGLHRGTMQALQNMLYHLNPAAQLYKQAFDLTRNMPADRQCRIALCFCDETDRRCYNLPSDSANKIAVILPGVGNQPTAARDIVLLGLVGPYRE
jgi:hypothetical protein